MEIGRKIKENRINKELTQEQLAKQLNVSRTTISSWETGRTYPDLEMIVTLSLILETTLDQLLKGDEVVIKKITKDAKNKNRYKRATIFISILLLTVVLFLGMDQFSNQSMPAKNITNLRIEGDVLQVTFSPSRFYQYSGYMLEGSISEEGVEELALSITENFHLFSTNNQEETLEISLEQYSEHLEDIKEIILDVNRKTPEAIRKIDTTHAP